MDEKLAAIERAQVGGRRIAEADHAEEFVGGGIDHRDRVGELVRGIEPVAGADRHVRRRGGPGRLTREGGSAEVGEQQGRRNDVSHRKVSSR